MLSLSELLKAINKFYVLAMKVTPLIKEAALRTPSTAYEQVTENIYDGLVNGDFAEEFTKYLESYENFMNSLDISPEDFKKTLAGKEDSGNFNFTDYRPMFDEAFEEIMTSPYIQQGLLDQGWEEGVSPLEIQSAIGSLRQDAYKKMYDLGKAAGMTPSLVDKALEQQTDETIRLLQGVGEEGTGEGMSSKEIDFVNKKKKKMQEYGRAWRERLNESRAMGGGTNNAVTYFQNQVAQLQQQIASEVDPNKKDQLEGLLRDKLRRLKIVTTYKIRQERERDEVIKNPDLYEKVRVGFAKRQQSSREFNDKFFGLISAYDAAEGIPSPNERERAKIKIKSELVRVKKELLLRTNPQLDLDDPELRNNPKLWSKLQDELNPDKIIQEYRNRFIRRTKTEVQNQVANRWAKRLKGDLPGKLIPFQQAISTFKNEVRKRLVRSVEKAEELRPYFDARKEAQKSGNPAAIQAADEAAKQAQNNWVLNHPATLRAADAHRNLFAWRDDLDALAKSIPENEPISPEIQATIQELVDRGRIMAKDYAGYRDSIGGVIRWIHDVIKYIEESQS